MSTLSAWVKYKEEIKRSDLLDFASESNLIDGIDSMASDEIHANALYDFVQLKKIKLHNVQKFVSIVLPVSYLRTKPEHTAFISGEAAPSPEIAVAQTEFLLNKVNSDELHPWAVYADYCGIHPFICNNGLSGRAIWLWQMLQFRSYVFTYNFLQTYHNQTLQKYRASMGFML